MIRIGILQPGHAPAALSGTGDDYDRCFERLLAAGAFDFRTYDVEAGAFPESGGAADGWLITGSRHGVYEDHAWIPRLEALIREIHAERRPLVGICFGHQIIAQALGGEVGRSDYGWTAGPTAYRRGAGGPALWLNAWHRDRVVAAPPGVEVTMSAEGCPIAGLGIPGRLLSYQAHPEFDNAYLARLFAERGDALPEPLRREVPERLAGGRTDASAIAEEIIRLFQTARAPAPLLGSAG